MKIVCAIDGSCYSEWAQDRTPPEQLVMPSAVRNHFSLSS